MAPSSTRIYSFTVVALVDGEQTLYDIRNQELSTAFTSVLLHYVHFYNHVQGRDLETKT